ncbi:DNA polymerase III subunit beta [Streptacidiphilus griseoplanus]|uniref:DNA polymerase III subunit beta n=1 Tax=Peterkaempfera griseoplana TaxID=66896 RepID=UPI0006E28B5C|nr:DNA polymerase III subunit beta [Peterkaempfera griseoplana]
MRFRIERGALAEAVGRAARALPGRPSQPVLAGLRLTASEDRLAVAGYDHEVSVRVSVEAGVEGPGETLVVGRRLLDVCRVLPDGPLDCALEGARLAVAGGGTRFGLAALPLDDYPALPAVPGTLGELDAAEFADAVAQVATAAGRDDTLPVLTGVRLELGDGTLTLSATDRYRFAVRTLPWRPLSPMPGQTEAVVPARRLLEAVRSPAGTGIVRLALGDGTLGLLGRDTTATIRLLDGVLPGYASLFALPEPVLGVVERDLLVEAVKRVAVVTERHSPLRLVFTAQSLLLEAGAGDDDTASQRLPAALHGAPVTLAFNPGYLADALAALDAPHVEFAMLGPGQRVLLAGRDKADDAADPGHRHLLMSLKTAG